MNKLENKLEFDEWYQNNCDDMAIFAAESGIDRELDFDWDRFMERQYEKYLNV